MKRKIASIILALLLMPIIALAEGIDSYTKLLLHADGTDGSTTFTDSSLSPKAVTANGDAHVEVDQSKFGGASAYFDGTGDYLSALDSDDFEFDGDFTIDTWVKSERTSGSIWNIIATKGLLGVDPWTWSLRQLPRFDLNQTNWSFVLYDSGIGYDLQYSIGGVPDNEWHHLAITRQSNTLRLFADGVLLDTQTYGSGQTLGGNTAQLEIGRDSQQSLLMNGYIDEFRISKGIARWTTNFTPPTAPYSSPFPAPGSRVIWVQ